MTIHLCLGYYMQDESDSGEIKVNLKLPGGSQEMKLNTTILHKLNFMQHMDYMKTQILI